MSVTNLGSKFFNSLQPFEDDYVKCTSFGYGNFCIEQAVYDGSYDATKEINQVLMLFEKAIVNAQEKRLSEAKVVSFDYFSHLPPDKINEYMNSAYGSTQLFAATSSDESLVTLPDGDRQNTLFRCSFKAWQAIGPKFFQFLGSSYGIQCIEKKLTSFVDRYSKAHCHGNNPKDRLMHEIRYPNAGTPLTHIEKRAMGNERWATVTKQIAHAWELRTNSHEFILSWLKDWEPRALPDFPFPKVDLLSEQALPFNIKFLFDDLTAKRFTDIKILCAEGKSIDAHRLILIAASEYFKAMFANSMKEGISNAISFSEYKSTTVEVFLKFLYLEQDPFSSDNPETIDEEELLALAHLCQIHPLVRFCALYIGWNTDKTHYQEIGQLGAHFQNKFLLELYECYRNRKGKRLPEEMRQALKNVGISLPPSPSAKALIDCKVGYGNTLGLLCQPLWDKEFPSRFVWKQGKWKGHVPTNREFKFVQIDMDNNIKWEKTETNRILNETVSNSVSFKNVQF